METKKNPLECAVFICFTPDYASIIEYLKWYVIVVKGQFIGDSE